MKTAFIILAAGKGERLGGQPKQFRELGGKKLWQWSMDCAVSLRSKGFVDEIVIVFPDSENFCTFASDVPGGVTAVKGGATRSLSVLSALRATTADTVLLHDAARPFVDEELCVRCLSRSTGENAAIPLLPEANALKRFKDGQIEAVNRDGLYITQTPQLFPRLRLLRLLENSSDFAYKDEAELWLQHGLTLDWVSGNSRNFKVTERSDWAMAQALSAEQYEYRTGLGYDVHPLVPGRPLILGGVEVDSKLGLDGHSDADVLTHAICDSLLSAAGLPDIGTLYPASEERYKGICSLELLRDVCARLSAGGWHIDWISAVVTAQVPRLAPWKEKVLHSLENVLGKKCLSLAFKSGEGVPPVGTAQAVFAWGSSTVRRNSSRETDL